MDSQTLLTETREQLDRAVRAFEKENQTLRNCIGVLKAVAEGRLPTSRLQVTDNSWNVLPEGAGPKLAE